jgi:hypothetical protein
MSESLHRPCASVRPFRASLWHYLAALIWSLALGLIVLVRPAAAHGDVRVLQLAGATAGPYRLTVWTSPEILRTGEIHVEVAVEDRVGGPAGPAVVQVTMSPLDGTGQTLTALARPGGETGRPRQEAALVVDRPGRYRVEVAVSGRSGAVGSVGFPVEVLQVPVAVRLLLYVQFAGAVVAAAWMGRMGKRIWFGGSIKGTLSNSMEKHANIGGN